MKRTKLFFRGVSEIVGNTQLAVLMLTDEEEQRQITIVCDKVMAVQIEMRMKRLNITAGFLPEVLCCMLSKLSGATMEVIITSVDDGQYRCFVCFGPGWIEPIAIRASDAVLLSLITDTPIYMESGLFKLQSVQYKKNSRGVALPVNTLSADMLQEALDKAINDENYELASKLRDEKLKRGAK